MAEQIYTYAISTDFPGGAINAGKLHSEIAASAILTAIERVDTAGDSVDVVFKAPLSTGDKTLLDNDVVTGSLMGGLIAAHDNTANTQGVPVLNDDNVSLSVSQPQRIGYELCERDFKITTCKFAQIDAVDDLLINVTTLKEVAWAGPELALVGVYKLSAGSMVLCVDQADADANGILSVWDYKAFDQADGTTEIPYNLRNGAIVAEPSIISADRFKHRAYVVVAPDLGQANYVRIFDGYIAARPVEGELSVESPQAKLLDPALAPGANVVRIYVAHPQGQSDVHVLWLMTYRPKGTF